MILPLKITLKCLLIKSRIRALIEIRRFNMKSVAVEIFSVTERTDKMKT